MLTPDPQAFNAMPPVNANETFLTAQYFQAVDNMIKVFAIRPDDRLLFLSDFLIDPRVFMRSRASRVRVACGPRCT
ncbi:MAG: hypothetical protein LW923_11150 [Betaproteobacteria bacterium]|nr:hypothetical protein [Betaproteobacteria bacterium]